MKFSVQKPCILEITCGPLSAEVRLEPINQSSLAWATDLEALNTLRRIFRTYQDNRAGWQVDTGSRSAAWMLPVPNPEGPCTPCFKDPYLVWIQQPQPSYLGYRHPGHRRGNTPRVESSCGRASGSAPAFSGGPPRVVIIRGPLNLVSSIWSWIGSYSVFSTA